MKNEEYLLVLEAGQSEKLLERPVALSGTVLFYRVARHPLPTSRPHRHRLSVIRPFLTMIVFTPSSANWQAAVRGPLPILVFAAMLVAVLKLPVRGE
jgi:hypothetical protein